MVQIIIKSVGKDEEIQDHGVDLDEVGPGLFDALFASLSMILVSEVSIVIDFSKYISFEFWRLDDKRTCLLMKA